MSTTALCVYCEELRVDVASHAMRTMRCPLCHCGIGVTEAGGKFRLGEVADAPPPAPTARPGYGLGILGAVWRRMFVAPPDGNH